MIPKAPQAGMVLHYSFLWKHEAKRGQEEGAKDRPVVVLVLLADGEEVVVAPITTLSPDERAPALEVPSRVRAHLGLDANQSWISLATLNRFVWPGPDLRPVPGSSPADALYGFIPQKLLDAAQQTAMAELAKRVPGLVVRRTEE
ncbi:MAG TPA: hypothetical protein VEA80_04600 [Vitreimonas sp.]|uniref:hypothetical protein n=1 Tax=Vitreimonas sp. TaxID=3069702 RepID=UPI002D3B3399|nr:hypothetical protein [Vitreimonas sp.]HYD86732.1 hypothetical protein [Vitreimonas sp.]